MTAMAVRAMFSKARTQIEGPRDVLLLIRMVGWGLMLRGLKHHVALPRLVQLARRNVPAEREVPRSRDEQQKVATLARWACRPMPWSDRGSCLERSLVAYRYLIGRNANPVLVIGVTARSQKFDLMHGHVWVLVNDQPVGETAESLSDFHAVMKFDANGSLSP